MSHSSSAPPRTRRRLPLVAGLVALAAGSGVAADGEPQLVKDIKPGAGGSAPFALTEMNGTLYFLADDGVHGLELWRSDGTAAGTVLVKDIQPGPFGSSISSNVVAVNGKLFFIADDGTSGPELWRSDGTEDGTVLFIDFGFEAIGGSVAQLTNANGRLFFSASDLGHSSDASKGNEVYSTDGTLGFAGLTQDVYPGSNGSSPSIIATVGGTIFFDAQGDLGVRGLWKSDGTELGTMLVKDLNPEIGTADLAGLTNLNANFGGTFLFSGNDGAIGNELWKSDGTELGTVLVKDINPGAPGSGPSFITFMDSTAYFSASDGTSGGELWKSDGTKDGTVLVKDINPIDSSGPTYLTVVNGKLYFEAHAGGARGSLWQSDGTAAGTVLVSDIHPIGDVHTGFANVNGRLYFQGVEDVNGVELWTSDRTPAGTKLLADIAPGSPSSQPRYLTVVGDTLFFTADDGANGNELWKLRIAAGGLTSGTGTVGTIVEVRGAGFGAAKGRVEMTRSPGKVPKKVVLKVLDWSDTVIHATVPNGFGSPARCDVAVTPKGGARQVLATQFQFLAPQITGASPAPSPTPWTAGQTITLSGASLGTARGKVSATWIVGEKTLTKPCKVLTWPTTAAGGGDGAGEVTIQLPKSFVWPASGAVLTLTNKVGSAVLTAQ